MAERKGENRERNEGKRRQAGVCREPTEMSKQVDSLNGKNK